LLAALLGTLPRKTLRRLQLVMSPDTVLRWHRDLLNRRHAARSRPKRPGRPRTVASIRRLVLRLAHENGTWGYRRIHGELALPGVTIAASTVWEILKDDGIDPSPDRAATSWAAFLRGQAEAILACHFIETVTLSGQRQYILAVIEYATCRIRILGITAHPTASWVSRAARNLAMDLEAANTSIRYLIRDRDGKFCALCDEVLADAGIQVGGSYPGANRGLLSREPPGRNYETCPVYQLSRSAGLTRRAAASLSRDGGSGADTAMFSTA
jgi:hypothetical protein